MTRSGHFLLTALLLAASTGCTDRDSQKQPISAAEEAQLAVQAQAGDAKAAKQLDHIQKVRAAMPRNAAEFTPDIRDGWQWPAEEVAALIKRAKSGDMEAADRLHQYYSVHEDEVQIAYWEDWLFKRGDPGAIDLRAQRLYSTARKRANDDPRKLVELREAGRLYLSLPPEQIGTDDYFLENVKSELVSIGKSRAVTEKNAQSRY